jgi:S-adenosylmethionine synthetase
VERFVRSLELRLHDEIDAVGRDVKPMALRRDGRVSLTVGAAVVDRLVAGPGEYDEVLARVEALAERHAAETLDRPLSVRVNAADAAGESLYLTTTGLSAEAGDDGGGRAGGTARTASSPPTARRAWRRPPARPR